MDLDGLSILNPFPRRSDGPSLLHELVESSSPERIALEHLQHEKRSSYTYAELHNASNNIAHKIRAGNHHSHEQLIVPVLLAQSPCLYAVLLGILKAGGAFCPLNLDAPPERLRFIVEDVGARVVVVSSDLQSRLEVPSHVQIIALDALDVSSMPASSQSQRDVLPDSLAYVMYTSGSTGTPKGVAISHDAATQALLAHEDQIPQFSRFFQFAAPTFDVSVFEIFFPLSRGKTLVSASRLETLNDLPGMLSRMDVDACELTPTVAAGLLQTRRAAPQLRTLLTIGEMLNSSVVGEFGSQADMPSILWAMYGPTEAVIHCTLEPAFSKDLPVGTIGKPLSTVSCFIIDENEPLNAKDELNILPQGQTGELAIGGFQLADGYLNRPEQTTKSFIQTQFGRIYRTGDKARLRDDGLLECMGRLSDGQVKLRGQRIELGEIEHAILSTPGCRVATAIVSDSVIIGFCSAGNSVREEDILTRCARWLPQYMVPSEIIVLPRLPMLPSGKVDKASLKLVLAKRDDESHSHPGAPGREDEHDADSIRAIAACLGTSISSSQTLSSLGIDSLRAIKLSSELRKVNLHITVASILRARTISDFCRVLRQRPDVPADTSNQVSSLMPQLAGICDLNPSLKPISSRIVDILPCTPLQSAMLAANFQFETAYHNEVEFEVGPQVSLDLLVAGLQTICDQNEVLRTGFVQWQDRPVAVVFDTNLPETVQLESLDQCPQPISWLRPLRVHIIPSAGRNTVLGFKIHHAIYDGWSLDAVLHDLAEYIKGHELAIRPQFSQVLHHYNVIASQSQESNRTFWADHLANWERKPFPVLIEEPKADLSAQTLIHHVELDQKVLDAAIARTGCRIPSILTAALCLVWKGILGSEDFVIGTVTSGRVLPIADIAEIIGPCVAALPLRIKFEDIETSGQLVKYIDNMARHLMENSRLPLSDIKKSAGLQAWEGLYDVLFTFQESLFSNSVRAGPFTQKSHVDRLETKLLIEAERTASGFALQATYHTDVMDSDMAQHILNQMSIVINDDFMVKGDSVPRLWDLRDMSPSVYNHSIQPSQCTPDLATCFEEVSERLSSHPALEFMTKASHGYDRDTMSYQELNQQANQVARFLQHHGAAAGSVIGLIMEKSPFLYVCILGIVKAGCAYLPLLPSTPRSRVNEVLRQSSVSLVLVDRMDAITTHVSDNINWLSPLPKDVYSFSTTNICLPADANRPAYVIFTSGTTGVPKGVTVSQKNITSNIEYLRELYPSKRDQQGRLLQACSQAFDVSVFEIFFSWLSGMCLCAGTNDTLFADLERSIRTLHITHLSLTPTVAALIEPTNVPSVEFLVTAGEPLTWNVLERWQNLLWQGYGPSETTNICTVKQMSTSFNIEHLGKVFPNTSCVVLQSNGDSALPIGWVGELCFGGEQVALGYLNQASLTSSKFINHRRYGRLYRSGDLGRMLSDGTLVILGRLDDQVKLRGQRIETTEIDNTLSSHEGVHSAVTILLESDATSFSPCLASFLTLDVASGEQELSTLAPDHAFGLSVRGTLTAHLPSYMIPTYIIPLTRIPRTSSGKCDRQTLRELFRGLSKEFLNESAGVGTAREDDTDWEPREQTIRNTIARTLRVPEVEIGRWTSLGGIGLDSISAIAVARDLSSALGIRVAISTLLTYPCVSLLHQNLREGKVEESPGRPLLDEHLTESVLAQFAPADIAAKVLPCTPLQEAMLAQADTTYYNKILLRLRVSPSEMIRFWAEMFRRHEILSTCFMTTDDREFPIVQVVLKDWPQPWQTLAVNELSLVNAVEEQCRSLAPALNSRVPPLSLAIISCRGSYFLSFVCHHALYDGTAINILWREIESLSRGYSLPPPVCYEPFLRRMLQRPDDATSFWSDQFHHCQAYQVFYGRHAADKADQAIHTARFEYRLDVLQSKLRSSKIGLLPLCQAAWASVLSSLTGSHDVVFGSVVSGRNVDVVDIERLVAPCFNTVPFRKVLDPSLQNSELLLQLHNLNQYMASHQFASLRQVSKHVGCRRLFDTLLLVQQPLEEMDPAVWTLEEDIGEMDVPVICEVTPCPNLNTIAVKIYYDMHTITGNEITAVADEFTRVVAWLIDSPFASLDMYHPAKLGTRPKVAMLRQLDDGLGKNDEAESDWSPLEIALRDTFSAVSAAPLSIITRSTTIFRLGIDSISVIQLAAKLRAVGHQVSTVDVLEHPTCEKLARHILSRLPPSDIQKIDPFDFDAFRRSVLPQVREAVPAATVIEDVLPCSALQCAMASSCASNHESYMNLVSFKLEEGISVAQVTAAWETVRRQHHMLRTALIPVSSRSTPYAMVRYSSNTSELPVGRLPPAQPAPDLRLRVGTSLLEMPHAPPWRVILAEEGESLFMHLVIHHALYDATSLRMILANVGHAIAGRSLLVSPDPRDGLSEILTTDTAQIERAKAFWKDTAPKLVINRFPVLTPLREDVGQRLTLSRLSRLSFSSIVSRAKNKDVTVQVVIEASWARLLATYTGEDAVAFGVTLSTRTTEATAATPIPCLTTLPVITRNTNSNDDLLRSIAEHDAKLSDSRSCSLSAVQRWLGHPASMVFDTLVTYQGHLEKASTPEPWKVVEELGFVEFPLSLEAEPIRNDQLALTLNFSTSTVPREQAEYILTQFDATMANLLDEAGSDGLQSVVSDIDLFSVVPPELPEIPTDVRLLHDFVEVQAMTNSHATALEFTSGSDAPLEIWTYEQLNEMGNRVAAMLQQQKLEGAIIAIHFDKCPEAYFAILGILKAGFAFVALDPSMPRARKEFIMQDSQACGLLTAPEMLIDFDIKVPLERIDGTALRTYQGTQTSLSTRQASPFDTCYCLYTSGTTGTPKGCEITHENAVQAMMAFQHLFRGRWNQKSRWLQFAALHFDVSVLEQYWTWSVGMTLVVTPRDVILDDLAGTISRLKITHLDLTPSLARLLDPEDVPTLWDGVFITGGEQLKQEILDVWGPKGAIYNAYGPTEATIGVTTFPQVPQNGRPSNIGQQFLNVGTYVLYPNTETPVLRGGVGELCIAGKLVGKGYINREDVTRERFPYLSTFGERVYRTGDLVRLLFDGSFEFLGRADDQVKLRGQRLELGEIDHVIRRAVTAAEDLATIVVTQKAPDRSVLVCFLSNGMGKTHDLQPMQDEHNLGQKARAACRSSLPEYMVPTYFVVLPYIPLSINNKAEHKIIRKVFEELSPTQLIGLSATTALPMTEAAQVVLKQICHAIADFTGAHQQELPSNSSIFDIGIDSVNVALFSASLRKHDLSCSPATILQNPILGDLAGALAARTPQIHRSMLHEAQLSMKAFSQRHMQSAKASLGLEQSNVEYIAPCMPLQEGMVSGAVTRGLYFVSFDLQLSNVVDLKALRAAWSELIQRHAILRTLFLNTSDGCVQVALREQPISWEETASADGRHRRRQTWIAANNKDIRLPLQFTILRSQEQLTLCVDIFHGIYDGSSLHSMLREAADIYNGSTSRTAPSFIDVMSHGPLWRFDFCKDFWLKHFHKWEPFSLRIADPVPDVEHNTITASGQLPRAAFESVLKSQNITSQSLMLALWTAALRELRGTDPTTGLVIGGRSLDLEGVEDTVGPLFNTLPFYSGSCIEQSWSGFIKHCHQFSTAILDFQHVPLRTIQKWCAPGQPLIDNLLTVQAKTSHSGGHLWDLQESSTAADYPLALEATLQQSGGVHLHLVAADDAATEDILKQLLDRMNEFLELASQDGEAPWRGETTVSDTACSQHQDVEASLGEPSRKPFEWTPRAKTMQRLLADLAQCPVDAVGERTSILALGLDSIDTLRLSSQLRGKGINVAPSTIMRHQTIESILANGIEDSPARSDSSHASDLQDIGRQLRSCLSKNRDLSAVESLLPTTPVQEGMVMAMIESNFAQYFNHEVLQLSSEVLLPELCGAWNQVIEANQILRTGFAEVSDSQLDFSYCQVVHPFSRVSVTCHDLASESDLPSLFDIATEAAKQELGWSNLLQVQLANCESVNYMVVSMAHALYDGWSLGLLYRDLQKAYHHNAVSRSSPTNYLSRCIIARPDEARSFWKDFMHGAQRTMICPPDETIPEAPRVSKDSALSKVSPTAIVAFCKEQGVSLQVLFYACWATIVSRRAGQLDVSFGTVLSGRDFEGAEDLMFPTMNTVLQRCILTGTRSSFLSYLEANMRDIRHWQFYPLRKALGVVSGGKSFFDSLFMVQKDIDTESTEDSMFKPVMGGSETEHPICAESELTGGSLVWRITSRSPSYGADEVSKILAELDLVLHNFITSPHSDLVEMSETGASICGLTPVPLRDDASASEATTNTPSDVPETDDWNLQTVAIAEVLSSIAHIPVDEIQLWNTIYHLGLDSITAIKASAVLRQRGIPLRPRDLLLATDVSHMAQIAHDRSLETIEKHGAAARVQETWTPPPELNLAQIFSRNNISEVDVDVVLPASAMQLYMIRSWYDSCGSIFFPEFRIELPSTTSASHVERAWRSLQERVPFLKTVFCPTESEEVPMLQVLLKSGSQNNNQWWIRCWAETDNEGRQVLVLKVHHALYDAFSLSTLLQRLVKLCLDAEGDAQSVSLKPWIKYSLATIQPGRQDSRRQFWQEYLKDATAQNQSTHQTTLTNERTSEIRVGAVRDPAALRHAAAKSGTSVQALFLAAYAKSISPELQDSQAGQSIVLGIYLANQDQADSLPGIYPTLCIVPIKVRVDPGNSLLSAAHAVQKDLNEIRSRDMADVGLWEIKRWTGITIDRVVNFIAKDTGSDRGPTLKWLSPGQSTEQTKGVVTPESFGPWDPPLLREAYSSTIEVEASLDEGLTVGVFGPSTQLTQGEASSMVDEVITTLLVGLS